MELTSASNQLPRSGAWEDAGTNDTASRSLGEVNFCQTPRWVTSVRVAVAWSEWILVITRTHLKGVYRDSEVVKWWGWSLVEAMNRFEGPDLAILPSLDLPRDDTVLVSAPHRRLRFKYH